MTKVVKDRFKLPVAVHLLIFKGDEVLLSLRKNTGYMDDRYSIIAGHIDGNENIVDALIREAKEEGNLDLNAKDLSFGCVLHRRCGNQEIVDFFFTMNDGSKSVHNAEPDKCAELKFFPINRLPENIVPYIVHGIDCVVNKIPQSTFGW